MKRWEVQFSPSFSTEIYFGSNLLEQLKQFCNTFHKKVVVTDLALKNLYGNELSQFLNADLVAIPEGEKAKTKDTLEDVLGALFRLGVGRDGVLVALGGGVVMDLVGFAASIYMRGMPLILIPTTLLGMVDAAIGGKTAIDTSLGKNLIGTIYHPKAIFTDLSHLNTLTQKEWFNGLAEILKLGLSFDVSLWKQAQKNPKDPDLILKAMQGKLEIVKQDLLEQGLRRVLNFGHTIAHALEKIACYELPHGQAVAMGCVIEAHLSMRLGYLSEENFEEIEAAYRSFSLALPKAYTRQNLFQAMLHDKKKAQDKVRFVLIDQIGHALPFEGQYCRAIAWDELETTFSWMEEHYG